MILGDSLKPSIKTSVCTSVSMTVWDSLKNSIGDEQWDMTRNALCEYIRRFTLIELNGFR